MSGQERVDVGDAPQALHLEREAQGKRVLLVCDRTTLANQTSETANRTTPSEQGLEQLTTERYRNDLDWSTGERHSKRFDTMRAGAAMAGVALHRTDPQDGPVQYVTGYQGRVQLHRSIEDALAFISYARGTRHE